MQTKPIRGATGADITESSLRKTLQNLGLKKEIRDLSYVEKRLLIVISLTEQLKLAQGDLARTIESTANQLKIMQQQLGRLKVALGGFLDIFANRLLPYINGFLMALVEIIEYITQLVRKLLGLGEYTFDYSDITGTGDNEYIDELVDGLDEANEEAEKLKKNLIGIDELNILQPQEDEDTNMNIDPAILAAFTAALSDWDNKMDEVDMKAKKIRDTILSWFGLKPEGDTWGLAEGNNLATKLTEKIQDIVKWWKELDTDKFLENLSKVKDIIEWLFKTLLAMKFPLLAGILKMIEGLTEMATRGADFENIMDIVEGIGWILFWIGGLLNNDILLGIGLVLIGLSKFIDDWNKAWEDGKLDVQDVVVLLLDLALVVLGTILIGKVKVFASLFSKVYVLMIGWLKDIILWIRNMGAAIVAYVGGNSAAGYAILFLLESLAKVVGWLLIVKGLFDGFSAIKDWINGTITPLQGVLRVLKSIGLVLLGIMLLLGRWVAAAAAGIVFIAAGIADAAVTKNIEKEKASAGTSTDDDVAKKLDDYEKQLNDSLGISNSTLTTPSGGYDISSLGLDSSTVSSIKSTTTGSQTDVILTDIRNAVVTIASDVNSISGKDFTVNIDSREVARANTAGSQKLGTSQLGGVFTNV